MDRIKISDIRAQFPMYADVPDEQLVLALRKKFYPDIPLKDFVNRIEFTAPDPTEGMSGFDKFRAGIGKAMTDVARGVGQVVGAVSREDVAESRKRDKALMDTGAGMAGNITGNVAMLLPTVMIPGANTLTGSAAIGAVTGLVAPSTSTQETLTNIGIGTVAAPASIMAGRGVAGLATGTRALMDPFTKKGQERIAARTLQQFATDPTRAATNLQNARALVPGSMPTMAQAADDAGLAQLERTLLNNPETGGIIAGQKAAQRTARLAAVQDVAGTDDYYNSIKEGIRVFAKQDYDAAIKAGFDPKALEANADNLAKLLTRPSIQSAQATARRLAAETGEEITDFGSVRGLDYLVKALDNDISRAIAPNSSIGKAELRALLDTKNDLVQLIEKVSPAYREAQKNFRAMSQQKNSMDVARDLLKRMESPLARFGADSREMKNAYATALEQATTNVKKQTGQNVPLSSVMRTKDVQALERVAQDMARAANADDMGRAVGSNTEQNLAARNLLRRILGPTGLPETWAESNLLQGILSPYTGVVKLAGSERAIMDRLAAAAIDPTDAANLLLFTQQPSRLGLLGPRLPALAPIAPLTGLLGQPQ